MATGIVDPKKDTVAVLDQSQVYGLYHASAATHDLILPVNQRFIIMILDTAVNYSGIMKAAAFVLRIAGKCFSADTLRNRANKIRVKYDSDETVKAVRITNDTLHTFTLRFTEEHFSKMVPVPIGKDWFPGPVNPEECLTIRYGDYMTLPPEEERIPHWGFIAVVPENFVFEYDPRLDAGEQA